MHRLRERPFDFLSAALLMALAATLGAGCGTPNHYGALSYDFAPPVRSASPTSHQSGETYAHLTENSFEAASSDDLATFSLDVDTASYTIMRRDLRSGALPVPDGVRVEEYVNFFNFADAPPPAGDTPFAVHLEVAPSFFGENEQGNPLHLLRIGVQGMTVPQEQRPSANLVFLIDVSGSMASAEKLGLVQYSLNLLTRELRQDDTIGIVVYAGSEGVVLEPTPVYRRSEIFDAIRRLGAGGSTNGEAGIRAAYDLAGQAFRRHAINRVVLCTDGDFNVGLTGSALIDLIEEQRERDITLTVLGFGRGNINDRDMERLADHGNGNYAFIDGEEEAQRVLQENLGGTLQVIAKDAKVQVAVNPDVVARYRLVGYENRVLDDQDFANDQVDAAEIGAGVFTTAFLELELKGDVSSLAPTEELARVFLRYKEPDADQSREVSYTVRVGDMAPTFESASPAFRFGAAVAEFAEILRQSKHSEGDRFGDVVSIASAARFDQDDDLDEFVELVERAESLWSPRVTTAVSSTMR